VSVRPNDPSPHDAAPPTRDGETDTPPPGFFRSAAALFDNRSSKVLVAIVVLLLVILGVVMVLSVESTSKGPGPGAAVPHVVAAVAAVLG